MAEALSIPVLICDGYEADDIIGTLVRPRGERRLHVLHGYLGQGLRPAHHGEHLHLQALAQRRGGGDHRPPGDSNPLGRAASRTRNVQFQGIQFAHSTTTYMMPYEVPSGAVHPSSSSSSFNHASCLKHREGGDWSIHRGGTFFVDGAEAITVENCMFDQTGGNALFLSNYVSRSKARGESRPAFIDHQSVRL